MFVGYYQMNSAFDKVFNCLVGFLTFGIEMVALKGLIVWLKMEAFDKMFFIYQLIYD